MAVRLVDITPIAHSLKTASTKAITLLNSVIFDTPHDRTTRSKFREFTGFSSTFNVEERKIKIKKNLSVADLIQVANILHLEISTDQDTLCNIIFDSLTDISELKQKILNDSPNSELEEFSQTPVIYKQINTSPTQFQSSLTQSQHVPFSPSSNNVSDNNLSHAPRYSNIAFSIKEIAEEIHNFDGTSVYPIESFIDSITNISELYNLSDIHTLAVAKRSLIGTAKVFLDSIPTIHSWSEFKNIFLDEFRERYTSADIHKILTNRSMRKNESCTEYLITMRQIAQKAAIDEKSVVQYVIQGLPDSPNKLLLYGCENFKDLKQKLQIFENLCRTQSNAFKPQPDFSRRSFNPFRSTFSTPAVQTKNNPPPCHPPTSGAPPIKCFQCGENNHVASQCTYKEIRCFYCKNFGHKITSCPKKALQNTSSTLEHKKHSPVHQVANHTSLLPSMTLSICIADLHVTALVDTGSQYTLVRQSLHHKLGSPTLQNTSLTLTGLGATLIHPIGFFHMPFKILNTTFISDFFVIPDDLLSVEAILGNNVLQQAEFRLNKSGVELIETERSPINSAVHFCIPVQPHVPNADNIFPFSHDLFTGIVQSSDFPDLTHISDVALRTELLQAIISYKPMKTKSPDVQMNIVLLDDRPVHHRPRRLPQSEQSIVDNQIQTWLKDGIIKPSSSEYSSPVFLCKKKDGSPRLCIDYRQLNKKIVRDRFPLPLIEDVIDRLENCAIFTKLDLKNGFFHVPINPKCTKFTSFVVPNGQYEFLFAPFGLCVSPNIFQRYIYAIFRPLMAKKYCCDLFRRFYHSCDNRN